ncbi:MAG: PAS domain S-box protein [Elusimicrobia bacterium]|nr:PAS domain S-box protein [Elusimicrobiota bacterium]
MRVRSLRSKLVVLVTLAACPPLAFFGHVLMRDRRALAAQSQEEILLLARLLAGHQERVIGSTRDLLAAFSSEPAVLAFDAGACGRRAKRLLEAEPHLLNIGVAGRDGNVLCSALPHTDRAGVADQAFFRRALTRARFDVEEVKVGRISGRPGLKVGYPVLRDGRPVGVAYASISPDALAAGLPGTTLEPGSVMLLIDRAGAIVARHPPPPEPESASILKTSLGQRMMEQGSGSAQDGSLDGRLRSYGFATLPGLTSGLGLRAVVGLPYERHLRELKTVQRRSLLALAVLVFIVLALTWWYGERFILRGVEAIEEAAGRLGRGDLSARAVAGDRDDELGRLAETFNEMAEAVERLTERGRLILESADEGILGFDENQRTSFANAAAARLLGWEPSALLGMDFGRTVHGPEADTPKHRATCPLRLALNRSEPYRCSEDRFARRDGTRFPVEYSLAPIKDAKGYRGSVVVFRDVSRERVLRQQLLQAQKMESVGRLAGGVAHDFNNLLTAVGGFAHLLGESLPEGDPRADDVDEIRRAVERGAGLMRQLLAFSRQQVMQPRVVDLNEIVAGCSKMLKRLLGEDVRIELRLAGKLGAVRADPGQIEQVLMNLVVNARDAMPGGGALVLETANAELDAAYAETHLDARPGPYVMLAVSDTGTGIPPEILPKIFDPFFTTKELGKGTGLGLATVDGIAKQHQGAVLVYSEPGRGTTFKVYLPRVAEPAEPEDDREPEPAAGGTERLLLVEDDEPVRRFARRVLAGKGYDVVDFGDPVQALASALPAASTFKLLVTDVVMPGLRGPELARELRARNPGLKVLFISGYTEGIARVSDLAEDSHYLQKPLTPDAVARKVREILDA